MSKYSIAYKGLSVGTHHISMHLDNVFFEAFNNAEIISGEGSVEIELTKSESLLTLSFEIKAEIGVECDRCLDEAIIPVEYEGDLIVRFSETEEESDGDIMWLSSAEDEIPLDKYIYESIYLSLPYQRVHPMNDEGESNCNPEMLEHFKIVSDEEFDKIASKEDTSTIEDSQWAKLFELKEKMTQK